MKHNFLKIALVAAVVATAGYGVYENQRQDMMSEVMMENVEALASAELSNGKCLASWDKECCVCNGVHFTFAEPIEEKECDHRIACSHYE